MNPNLVFASMIAVAIVCVGGLHVADHVMEWAVRRRQAETVDEHNRQYVAWQRQSAYEQQRRQNAYALCVQRNIANMDAQARSAGDVFGRVPLFMLEAVANSLATARQSQIAEIEAYCGQN